MMKLPKKAFAGDVLVCLLLVLLLISSVSLFTVKKSRNEFVRVLCDGREISVLPLSKDREELYADGVRIRVRDGRAYIYESDCPDRVCIRMHGVDGKGGGAVCLPNRVVLEPYSDTGDTHYIIG